MAERLLPMLMLVFCHCIGDGYGDGYGIRMARMLALCVRDDAYISIFLAECEY